MPSSYTQGPWDPRYQHGGPPAALLAREVERRAAGGEGFVGRLAYDIRGPIPLAPMAVRAWLERPGRRVRLVRGELLHEDRVLVSVSAWVIRPAPGDVPAAGASRRSPELMGPHDFEESTPPDEWSCGFLASLEWRFVRGAYSEIGPAAVWIRPRVPLLAGESMSPCQRIVLAADSANGISAELDIRDWAFVPPELTVHAVRPPRGEWLCLDAISDVRPGAVGTATATLHDEDGPVARSAQSLLVARR